MPVFIPIKAFKPFYNSFSELLTPDGIKLFKEKVKAKGYSIFQSYGYSAQDQEKYIQSLSNPKVILFHSWVEQNFALFQLLTEQKLHLFKDEGKHLQHQYAEEYKSFISPFLAEELLKYCSTKEIEFRKKALSFCKVLDKNHNSLVELQLFSPILKKVKIEAKSCQFFQEEKELIAVVKPLCQHEIIESVNYLSRVSYSLKMEYVDAVLSVLKYKSCTPRFANWVLKELKQVELNNEHQYKINDLIKDLKKGDLQVRNQGKNKRVVKTSTILTFLAILLLSSSVFWLVKYQPFAGIEDEPFSNETSFMQFSVEERKKIDSLLSVMNGNVNKEQFQIDQGSPLIGESDILTVRRSFSNTVFEEIHTDFLVDAENRNLLSDSCGKTISFREIVRTENVEAKKGNIKAMLKNDSAYDVILVMASNNKKGKVFSTMIKSGETISFEIDKNDVFFLVAGNDFQKYTASKGIDEKNLPSKSFSHTFCEVDDAYLQSIRTVYLLKKQGMKKVKFLIMGEKGSYFSLIDIHSVLMEI